MRILGMTGQISPLPPPESSARCVRMRTLALAVSGVLLAVAPAAHSANAPARETPAVLLAQANKIAGRVRHDVPFVKRDNGEHGKSIFDHVQAIAFDAKTGSLVIDDAQTFWTEAPSNQAPPHTDRKRYLVPIGKAEVFRDGVHTYQGGAAEEVNAPIVAITCREQEQCVALLNDTGAAVAASAGVLECDAAQCGALADAMERLIAVLRRIPNGTTL